MSSEFEICFCGWNKLAHFLVRHVSTKIICGEKMVDEI